MEDPISTQHQQAEEEKRVSQALKHDDVFEVGGTEVLAGERKTIELPVTRLYTRTQLHMPVQVARGRKTGPVLFVSAAIHGDEINGVEIIRRLLKLKELKKLRGALIAAPVVNVIGFINHSRYLADRRDLNRCFPGSPTGPLADILAHIFMKEIAAKATHGIDIHTGAIHRNNVPQTRVSETDPLSQKMAEWFGAPIIVESGLRSGSLRQSLSDLNIPNVLYEAGEALRFDEMSIRIGVRGVLQVMRALGMLPERDKEKDRERERELALESGVPFNAAESAKRHRKRQRPPVYCKKSKWVRAGASGVFRNMVQLGQSVSKGQTLGIVADPFGGWEEPAISPAEGYVIGLMEMPLVGRGDALYHIAFTKDTQEGELVSDENIDAIGLPGELG